MYPVSQVEVEDALNHLEEYCLVDVRTPGEFQEGSIPGSINLPLFDENERKRIGLAYARNQRAAKFLALDIAAPKMALFVRRLARFSGGKPLLILCWRGGMRSQATVQFLTMAGLEGAQLRGGYHQYRRLVYRQLLDYELDCPVIVLKGMSGTGKTEILRRLAVKGYPALDLEGLAGHRGSSFGGGRGQPRSQKDFDSLLLTALRALGAPPCLIVEGESRRIGKICLPDFLFRAMVRAPVIEVGGSVEKRVTRILKDYGPRDCQERIETYLALYHLKGVLSARLFAQLKGLLDSECYSEFVALILTRHYDRLYEHRLPGKGVLARVNSDDCPAAVAAVENALTDFFPPSS